MAYDKQTWTDNETLINAEHMNHIEDGIESAQSAAQEAKSAAEAAQSTANSFKDEVSNLSTEVEALAQDNQAVQGILLPLQQSAITAITLNGEDVPVKNNKAEITTKEPTYDADSETLIF